MDQNETIDVTWSAVTAPAPKQYEYRVVSLGAYGPSEPSDSAVGATAGRHVLGYELLTDDGAWTPVPGGLVTAWQDANAKPATLNAVKVAASLAKYAEFVRLVATEASATHGLGRAYAVRATTAYGPGPASGSSTGWRVAGSLSLQWERSEGPSGEVFAAVAGATGPSYDDGAAPADGSVRWYRVTVSAAGAASVSSDAVPGSRQPPPGVPGGVSATSDLTDKIVVRWEPVANAIGYRIYRDGQELTSGDGVTTTTYDDFSASGPLGDWGAPSGLTATSNDTDHVVLTWKAPSRPLGPAASYEVQALSHAGSGPRSAPCSGRRAGLPLVGYAVEVTPTGQSSTWTATGVTDVSWTDPNPPRGAIDIDIGGGAVASQGDHRRAIRLALSGAGTREGPRVTYRVRGVLQGAANVTPTSTSATGGRAVGPLVIQWRRSTGTDDGGFVDLTGATGTSFDDLGAPSDGGHRWYRVTLAAAGAEPRTLGPVEGWRLAFVAVDGGDSHACALTTEGRVWCWGSNGNGGLGLGNFEAALWATRAVMPLGVTHFVGLTAGESHTCARTAQGAVWCWGYNDFGQLGDGTKTTQSAPVLVLGLRACSETTHRISTHRVSGECRSSIRHEIRL